MELRHKYNLTKNKFTSVDTNCSSSPKSASNWVIVLPDCTETKTGSEESNKLALSQLNSTLSIAGSLVSSSHIVTVTEADSVLDQISKHTHYSYPGTIIRKPTNHGSASSIYLALAYILTQDFKANVTIIPSNVCFELREERLLALAKKSLQYPTYDPTLAVILATNGQFSHTKPDQLELGISTNGSVERLLYEELAPLIRIRNQSILPQSDRLNANYLLWNTGILTAKANLLWALCRKHLPALYERMDYIQGVYQQFQDMPSGDEYIRTAIGHAFYHLTQYNFFQDLVPAALAHFMALPIDGLQTNFHSSSQYVSDQSVHRQLCDGR